MRIEQKKNKLSTDVMHNPLQILFRRIKDLAEIILDFKKVIRVLVDLMAIHLIIQDQVKIIIILTQSSAKSASYLDIEQTNARIGSILVLYLKSIMAEEGLN